jgi:hypothetical protein
MLLAYAQIDQKMEKTPIKPETLIHTGLDPASLLGAEM